MNPLNLLKVWALVHAINNMSTKKIVDMIEDYQRKEFGEQSGKAIDVVADKLMRVALDLKRRV